MVLLYICNLSLGVGLELTKFFTDFSKLDPLRMVLKACNGKSFPASLSNTQRVYKHSRVKPEESNRIHKIEDVVMLLFSFQKDHLFSLTRPFQYEL